MIKAIMLTLLLLTYGNSDYLDDIDADYQFGANTDSTEKVLTVSTLKQLYKGWLPYWKDGSKFSFAGQANK